MWIYTLLFFILKNDPSWALIRSTLFSIFEVRVCISLGMLTIFLIVDDVSAVVLWVRFSIVNWFVSFVGWFAVIVNDNVLA
jgi:hypothetical protein